MEVLWKTGPATVGEVARALPKRKAVAYNSVLTILRILEQKGSSGTPSGRAFIYHTVIGSAKPAQRCPYLVAGSFKFSRAFGCSILKTEDHADGMKRLRNLVEEDKQEAS